MKKILSVLLSASFLVTSIAGSTNNSYAVAEETNISYSIDYVPDFSGEPYVTVNGNLPDFEETELLKATVSLIPLEDAALLMLMCVPKSCRPKSVEK